MILLPELKTVVVLVPRTGSGTLYKALLAAHPSAMMLYRHMEADGVPMGYDRWSKVGVAREPVARMWSMWKFMQTHVSRDDVLTARIRRQVAGRTFEDWLMHNEAPFSTAHYPGEGEEFYASFSVRHAMPENRKSQWHYLRPDLGTEIYQFGDNQTIGERLGIDLGAAQRRNVTGGDPAPELSPAARDYVNRVFSWELSTPWFYRPAQR